MYSNIVTKEVDYPAYLSKESIALLRGLLTKDPAKRMGAKQGVVEVKQADFFRGVDWDALLKKRVKCPLA